LEAHVAQVRNVSGTAFVVAEFRAEENTVDTPLYRDAIVGLFLDSESRQAAQRVADAFPATKDLVRIRTKYLDEMLDEQLRTDIRQVVILGAGLDTRAVRKPTAGVTYFEIDDGATLALKQARYREAGINADVKFIPGNYVTDGLIDLLELQGFDFNLPTYVIWEGNTMYLPLEATRLVLVQLRNYLRQFRLSFDYMADAVVSKTTGDPGITKLVESFAAMGAPWLSGIRDVHNLAAGLGLRVIENFKTAELHQKYWLGRPLASPIFAFYSLCTMGSVSTV
jgi:methyltransferase (TIGR00027 family)